MSIRNNKKFMTMMVVMVALVSVLAFSGAAYATPALYVIGSSGCDVYDSSIAATGSYGIDPTLPVLIAFNDDISGATLTTADFTFKDSSNNNVAFSVATSGYYGMDYNYVALIPSSTLASSTYYTIGFADDLAGNDSFIFKTKTPGGGGGTATLRCVGRIVDDGGLSAQYTGFDSAPYVPRDQQFLYSFSNAITSYASTNDDAIRLYKWIGAGAFTDDFTDDDNWEQVTGVTVTIDTSVTDRRWYVILEATSLLDQNTNYGIWIDTTMRANNGYYLGDEVKEFFKVGTVYDS